MFGKVARDREEAQALAGEAMKHPGVVRARYDAAMAVLKAQPQVDTSRIGVIGYCFGGSVALELVRAGLQVSAVATFHAALAPHREPAQKGNVVPRILVATGGADPLVPKAQVEELEKEMKGAGADFKVVVYPNAKHSFTNPDAGKAGMSALAYDAEADKKSWALAAV